MSDEVKRKLTEHGFQFGAATVECCASNGRGVVVVSVESPKATLRVYVTKTGKMRLFFNGLEVCVSR